jgi:hypothetical protein
MQQNEPSPAWQWSWFQYQLTLVYSAVNDYEYFLASVTLPVFGVHI